MRDRSSAVLAAAGLPPPIASEPLGGGCICEVRRLRFADGRSAVLKTHAAAPAGMFRAEAAGLRLLADGAGPRVPAVLAVGDDGLLIEDLGSGTRGPRFWEDLGGALAELHARTAPRFGLDHDNRIGLTPQANAWLDDGHVFVAERRFLPLARACVGRGLLDAGDLRRVDALCAALPRLVPAQPASLLHGDLWSGNVIACGDGAAAMVDPAVHFGWAETDIAMTALFGGFPERFYAAYVEAWPLPDGWRERLDLHNLYHLLNHALGLGGGYVRQARAVIARFAPR